MLTLDQVTYTVKQARYLKDISQEEMQLGWHITSTIGS